MLSPCIILRKKDNDTFPTLFYKENTTDIFDLYSPFEEILTSCWTVDSVNGLICIFSDMGKSFLWNPAIRKCKKVPTLEYFKWGDTFYFQYGFGYDEPRDDYKVVVVQCIESEDGCYKTLIHIYSLRSGSWREVHECPGYLMRNYSAKYFDGKIYWAACALPAGVDEYCVHNFISFDLADETWGKLDLPYYGEVGSPSHSILGVVGRDLSVLCPCHKKTTFDVWITKDYGVSVSWTKMLTIKYSDGLLKPMEFMLTQPTSSFYPFFSRSNNKGEMLILLPPFVIMYDPKDGSTRQRVVGRKRSCASEIFVESLIDS